MQIESTSPPLDKGTATAANDSTTDSSTKLLASAYNTGDQNEQLDSDLGSTSTIASMLSQSIWGSMRTENNEVQTKSDKSNAEPETIDFSVAGNDSGVENLLHKANYDGADTLLAKLSNQSNLDVGRTDRGAKVPSNAFEFRNMRVPRHNKCASTVSDWLISSGTMDSREFKIRVKDMNLYLAQKFGQPSQLEGNFSLEDFPQGPIGFISATGQNRNGTNHIAYVEREGNSVFIIHNKAGKVVKEDIRKKFYTSDGRPRYRDMKLFNLNQRGA